MRPTGPFSPEQPIVARAYRGIQRTGFWEGALLHWLPLLLGVALGPIIAILVVNGNWIFAVGLLILVPLLILLVTYPLAAAIVWLIVMPFFVMSPIASGSYVFWIFHRILVPLGLAVVVLPYPLRNKRYQAVRLGPAELAMAIFAVLVLMSILLVQPAGTRLLNKYYDRILIPYMMYLLVRLATPREKELKGFLIAAAVIAVSQSVIGILSWVSPQLLPPAWLVLQGRRTTGSLGQPAVYTAALVFGIALLYYAAMHRRPGVTRFTYLFVSGAGAICVFLSFSRGSWLGAMVVAAGLLALFPKPTLRVAIVLLVLVAFLGTGLLTDQMNLASDRLETVRTIDSRIVLTDAMLSMIKDKPIFGWGYENLDFHIRPFLRRVGNATYTRVDLTSHNTYLTIAVEMGLIGFLLYAFPAIWWLVLTIRVLPRMPKTGLYSRSLLIVLWLIVINQIVVSLFIDMRFFPFGVTLWWMTLGLIGTVVSPRPGPVRSVQTLRSPLP